MRWVVGGAMGGDGDDDDDDDNGKTAITFHPPRARKHTRERTSDRWTGARGEREYDWHF